MLCSENLGRTQTEGKLWVKLNIQKTAFVSEELTESLTNVRLFYKLFPSSHFHILLDFR